MIVCDDEERIRCVDAKHPGSCQDSRIWTTSQCREVLQREISGSHSNMWLLGDAGYALEPWLMTSFRSPQLGSTQHNFNDVHAKSEI
ncbi:PREDICTED: putative nuclease HARBI1 [Rhagoletis zephyria]|uniref:putative nuclease HARBI1 n=1 Tax=Rhagoletis zephyria TaxID=28612 RepID=UPI000811528A|nr:PREDICTED: putative nuclease HARBI1 [Rhagoletis zephyria]XP_036320669.1 putative nuclease HARBI1 [Rhagoletis pomonella]